MDALALDELVDEIIPRRGSNARAGQTGEVALSASLPSTDDADTALALISEVADAIRKQEEHSTQAIARAHDAANAIKEKLDQTLARAECAESALRQAKSEIDELATTVTQARDDIKNLQSLLAAREEDLASMERRATVAEKRADDAGAAIQRIVTAIHTQLPVASASGKA